MSKKKWEYPRHSQFVSGLRKTATEWFQKMNFTTDEKYSFILSEHSDWPNNIILPEVATYIKQALQDQAQFPLHKYVHHGLSSQAMLFNLIGPLICTNDYEPLINVLKNKGISWVEGEAKAEFEYEDRDIFKEKSQQPTSIDMIVRDGSGKAKIFIESKLVEPEFGGCSIFNSGDCDGMNPVNNFNRCYLHVKGRTYLDLLQSYGFISEKMADDSMCALAHNYQFFRELLFALEYGGCFVLLCDERSPVFYCKPEGSEPRGLMVYLRELVPDAYRGRVAFITVQDVLKAIQATGRHDWVSTFEEKYGIYL